MDENKIKERMEGVIGLYKDDISSIRTGRATPAIIEDLEISVYGGQQKMRLKQLGSISVPDPRTLTFQPWDAAIVSEVKNGIMAVGTGLTPVVEGNLIRISLPPLTGEQREDYVKLLSRKAEGAKVIARDIRGEERYGLQEQFKEKLVSEDDFHRFEKRLQEITDEYVAKIDEMTAIKEKEIRGE